MDGKRYLLDTNILSELIKNPTGPVANKIAQVGEETVCTSVIVAAELRYGAQKSGSPRLSAQVEAVLSALDILPLESPVDRHYGELRCLLEQTGQQIGANDLLIAAQTLAHELILVSHNASEFRRVPGLALEDWLE